MFWPNEPNDVQYEAGHVARTNAIVVILAERTQQAKIAATSPWEFWINSFTRSRDQRPFCRNKAKDSNKYNDLNY
jgi:hypothetical protein